MIKQHDIFGHNQDSIHFAELCNALYQRECQNLAESSSSQINLLKRKLKFLPQLVQECAHSLLNNNAPLEIDYHNASYQNKQAANCPSAKQTTGQIAQYYSKFPDIGRVLPVEVKTIDGYHFELDSVDRVDEESNLLHVNKHGWFHPDGQSQQANNSIRLVKPTKAIMQAACCGHQWRWKGKGIPRALSLRELKLSFHIQW